MLEYTIRTKAFRRGQPFSAQCTLEEDAAPIAIPADAKINGNLRTDNAVLVAHLDIALHDQTKEPGVFSVSVANTDSFPVGTNIYLTVIFTIGFDIFASATLSIPVIS